MCVCVWTVYSDLHLSSELATIKYTRSREWFTHLIGFLIIANLGGLRGACASVDVQCEIGGEEGQRAAMAVRSVPL